MDSGYIITGTKGSQGNSGNDVWLIKTDSQGNEEWNQIFSGDDNDGINNYYIGESVQQTTDGGYIITGSQELLDTGRDLWLIKTDSQGIEEWDQIYSGTGTSGTDQGRFVQQTSDGGYIIIGTAGGSPMGNDIWLIKTD